MSFSDGIARFKRPGFEVTDTRTVATDEWRVWECESKAAVGSAIQFEGHRLGLVKVSKWTNAAWRVAIFEEIERGAVRRTTAVGPRPV